MLERAVKRLKDHNNQNYNLQTGNVYQLPFDDDTFDLFINNFMFDLLPEADFNLILSEIKRVLKPSGRVVISTMAFGGDGIIKSDFGRQQPFDLVLQAAGLGCIVSA